MTVTDEERLHRLVQRLRTDDAARCVCETLARLAATCRNPRRAERYAAMAARSTETRVHRQAGE